MAGVIEMDFVDLSSSSHSEEGSSDYTSSDEETEECGIRPHLFEPEVSSDDEQTSAQHTEQSSTSNTPHTLTVGQLDRLRDISWCQCGGKCSIIETLEECVCCQDCAATKAKCDSETGYSCITQHPGFDAVCLNPYALETAYRTYRQLYGKAGQKTQNERLRYTAYRQMVFFCWGWLGKGRRVVIPSCAVKAIRENSASESYKGFVPNLD